MPLTAQHPSPFQSFRQRLQRPDLITHLHDSVIGKDATVPGPEGPLPLVYADYVASGRAISLVEDLVREAILPYYANSHAETSYCGALMTHWREEARQLIAAALGAGPGHAVVFAGSGATGGLNRIVHLLGLRDSAARGERPLVLIGPYEHHSNILPWRETGADVIEVPEGAAGGPDLEFLARLLAQFAGRPMVGAFSAASNVSGIVADVPAITRLLKQAGAKVVWDYAGGGPYLPITMTPAPDCAIDAIALSPHKFPGGPGASGVFAIRRDAVRTTIPTQPGGGTVRFVSPWGHDYSDQVEVREEGGTPNILGDLRAALALMIKEAVGTEAIARRNAELTRIGFARLAQEPRIEILGNTSCQRLPIFSFRMTDGAGGYVHQQLVTRLMSDLYGIQVRGGCACAGPYGHRLFHIDRQSSDQLRAAVLAGQEIEKLGFVRFNLSYLASDAEAGYILESLCDLARRAPVLAGRYRGDAHTASFEPVG
jgi:selenocysteine lyase/cysteine desulfurase